jgi:hypothetical protein
MYVNSNPVYFEKMNALQQQAVYREFADIRLMQAAGLSNPGLVERLWLSLARILMTSGQRLHERYTLPRQTYLDSAARFSA